MSGPGWRAHEGSDMARDNRLHPSQLEALRALIEYCPDLLLSMLADHGPGCHLYASAQVLIGMAEWDTEHIAQLAVEAMMRELGK